MAKGDLKIYIENNMLEKVIKSMLRTDKRIVIVDDTPKPVLADQIIAKDIGTRFEFYTTDSRVTVSNGTWNTDKSTLKPYDVLNAKDIDGIANKAAEHVNDNIGETINNAGFAKKDSSNMTDLNDDNKYNWVKNLGIVSENRIKLGNNLSSVSDTNNFNIAIGDSIDNLHAADSLVVGRHAKALSTGGIAIGMWWREEENYNTITGRDSLAIGPACVTKDARSSVLVGAYANIKGENNFTFGGGSYGDYIKIEGKNNLVLGYNFITSSQTIETRSSENYNEVHYTGESFPQRNMVLGYNNRLTDTNDNIILGGTCNIEANGANNVVILGGSTNPTLSNSIYLGRDVAADSSTNTKTVGFGNPNITLGSTKTSFAGTTSSEYGLLTIGKPGRERIIQNVAPGLIGPSSTDGVNGSQLNALIEAMGRMVVDITLENGNLKLKRFDGSTSNVDLSGLVSNNAHATVDDVLDKLAGKEVPDRTEAPRGGSSSSSSSRVATVKETYSD